MSHYEAQYPSQQGYPPTYSEKYPRDQCPSGPGYGQGPQIPQDRSHSAYASQPSYQPTGENASYYNSAPMSTQQGYAATPEVPEEERGLGSTLVGGAAGGYVANQMGGGALATAGGAVLGAAGMNMATNSMQRPPVGMTGMTGQTTTTTTTTTTNGMGRLGGLGGHGLGGAGLIPRRGDLLLTRRAIKRNRLGIY